MKTDIFEIKITGSGTWEEIVAALDQVKQDIVLTPNFCNW